MKKIMTLAVIALASVAMVACCGQQKPAEAPAQPETTCTSTECSECPKKAECPKAEAQPEAAPAAETAPAAPEAPAAK